MKKRLSAAYGVPFTGGGSTISSLVRLNDKVPKITPYESERTRQSFIPERELNATVRVVGMVAFYGMKDFRRTSSTGWTGQGSPAPGQRRGRIDVDSSVSSVIFIRRKERPWHC
jgi:hypothetical protein